MQFLTLFLSLAGVSCVTAFKDASPFIVLSTSELLLTTPQLSSSTSLIKDINSQLEKCPSDIYVVVSQPGVTVEDFSTRAFAPRLKSMTMGDDQQIKSSLAISNVIGTVESASFIDVLEKKCGAGVLDVDAATGLFDVVDDMRPRVVKVNFPPLPSGTSKPSMSRENDLFLSNLLSSLPSSKYTVLYMTSPSSTDFHSHEHVAPSYHMNMPLNSLSHMELKRDEEYVRRAANKSSNALPEGPLFERYAYFSSGLFMGLLVTVLLISVVYIGLSALSSLQVSYTAFDKDMGPAAQKKN